MWMPFLVSTAAVLAGTVLALLPRLGRASVGAVRTFALSAAVTVVVLHLLPESMEQIGLLAGLGFLGGLLAPPLIERGAHRLVGARAGLAVEVGYVGLLVHQIGDGTGLWVFTTGRHAAFDVALALAAHTVPVTTLVVLQYGASRGRTHALWRAAGLALASALGIVLGAVVPVAMVDAVHPWLAAVVSGLLIHVLGHDLTADSPRTTRARALDLTAGAAGVALTLAGLRAHHAIDSGGARFTADLGVAIAELGLETAPMLLVGLALGAAVQALGTRIPARWITGGGTLSQAVRGAVLGAPLPICACGVLPVARSLQERRAGAALVVAFLLTAPELGIETFALTVRFLGLPFALVRLGGALLVAIVAALVVGGSTRAGASTGAEQSAPLAVDAPEGSAWVRFRAAFDELMHHTAPWVFVGLLAAAYVQVVVPAEKLGALAGGGLDVLVVSAVAIPSYVCASSATPLAAILIAKGVSPGAVLCGLLLGPATNIATVVFLRRAYGLRAAVLGLLALLAATWAVALALNTWMPTVAAVVDPSAAGHDHGWLTIAAAVLLCALLLRSLWGSGIRAWLASLGSLGGAAHDHDHAHQHGHDHGHDHPHDAPLDAASFRVVGPVHVHGADCDHGPTATRTPEVGALHPKP